MWQRLSRLAPYHSHFLGSMSHAWLALITLGIGVAVATPLSLTIGLASYGLGVIFMPEWAPFRAKYDAKRQAEIQARTTAENLNKEKLRNTLLNKLSAQAKGRRQAFSLLCDELRAKLAEAEANTLMEEDSLGKVEDSHLLLLSMDADIREYLRTAEPPAELQKTVESIEAEVLALRARSQLSEVQQRLLLSKEETLRNVRQQIELKERMSINMELAQSELQRLESQLASLKAELISQPASELSIRLGETLTQVEASQRVLKEGGLIATPDLTTLLGEKA